MTLAAGIDVGNATTEVVLARLTDTGPKVVGAGRTATRRAKGSLPSLDGAAALLRRLEREHGVAIEAAVVAPLRPVETLTTTLPRPQAWTGRLRVVSAGVSTAGGRGFGVGRPLRVDGRTVPVADDLVVAVVPAGTGYRSILPSLQALLARNLLAAVLLEDDEAVLISNRLSAPVPVVDEVDAGSVLTAALVAVEVAEPGGTLRSLTDPLRLISGLGLDEESRAPAARIAARLYDVSNAVVAVHGSAAPAAELPAGWVEVGTRRLPFTTGHQAIRAAAIGLASAYALPPQEVRQPVDDLWTMDLSTVADTVLTRAGAARSQAIGLAALHADAPYADPAEELVQRLGVPVQTVVSEAEAARAGGLSTPGAGDAVVIDLGGGTTDAVYHESAVAAGGGELLTASVAALTGATRAAAEWIKRGPAHRVEAPQVLLAEDGSREFLDRPAAREAIGSLVVRGPAGLLPFQPTMAPGEWRALRRQLKAELIGGNVARALRTLGVVPAAVVVVGGPAGDDEVLSAVSRSLPDDVAVGRGNVAGSLGHRYAVAYGLLCCAGPDAASPTRH